MAVEGPAQAEEVQRAAQAELKNLLETLALRERQLGAHPLDLLVCILLCVGSDYCAMCLCRSVR